VQRLEFDPALEPLVLEDRSLLQELQIRSKNPQELLRQLRSQLGKQTLCRSPRLIHGVVTLSCRSKRIMSFHRERGVIEILELRVNPWRGESDGPPRFVKTELGRIDSERATLIQEVEESLLHDELPTAIGTLKRVSPAGHLGRLAALLRAELDPQGKVRKINDPLFDPTGLPASLREELVLRASRILAFQGDYAEAVTLVSGASKRGVSQRACRRAPLFCRSLALAALRSPRPQDPAAGLELYLSLPARFSGELALELAEEAARECAKHGAGGFAANLLSTITPLVPKEELKGHLRRTSALYRGVGDKVRASVIDEYARTLLPSQKRHKRRSRRHARPLTHPTPKPDEAPAPQVASATLASSVAR